MIINILAGGPEELLPDLTEYMKENVKWLGVDRGVYTLLSKGIEPEIAVGDFDSVNGEEMLFIEQHVDELQKFKPEKNETDMELAVEWAIRQNPQKINIFGATGGRLDHLFANIQLLLKPILNKKNIDLELIDCQNNIYIKSEGTYEIKKTPDRKYVSFVPITLSVEGLTLTGFKYPLTNCHIPLGSTLCISNELIDDRGTFSFHEGIIMVIRSCD
ncbi:thiamine diphosphokinase [Bacillus canaveralius]|uniref:Thiamine diphosphokinase n=1 Tax=Bacillus canaveralius TaxID=1403243 RepID=A0A2N5GNT9_9BACI|nr:MULTISPECIES: thiamine diphosphokinase [Bacillus]PLR84168.1 thiamine diphosphokinase [Bacillus canaveralius]PLR87513.1 thiamine diphosphokinase [Bacillus sp. V33-4]PLR96186.1 thiamine diphosphokinase [Bacillus canaveralius]RSK51680.1 thiamine diphosphokinase [Bacillus canaveralius]